LKVILISIFFYFLFIILKNIIVKSDNKESNGNKENKDIIDVNYEEVE